MIERFSSSTLSVKSHTSCTTSLLMIPSKSEKLISKILEETHSQSCSRDKSYQENSLSINQDKPMLKILLLPRISFTDNLWKSMEDYSRSKDVIHSPRDSTRINFQSISHSEKSRSHHTLFKFKNKSHPIMDSEMKSILLGMSID